MVSTKLVGQSKWFRIQQVQKIDLEEDSGSGNSVDSFFNKNGGDMSGQMMGANISQVLAGRECWRERMNVGRISQTQQTIRKIRARLEFSQEEFAQWLGLSVGTVTRWEAGNVKPTRMARRLIFDLFREEVERLKNLPPASRR